MTGETFSVELRNLVDDYNNHQLSYGEYRAQRKAIFDRIDEAYNGIVPSQTRISTDLPTED
jgi:hypothetical protein